MKFLEEHDDSFGPIACTEPIVKPVADMAAHVFGHAVIVKKGIVDIITDGREAFYVSTHGSLKRPGRIGDVLAGTIGTFSQFREGYRTPKSEGLSLKAENKMLPPCVIASLTVRQASKQAFEKKKHSLVCPDIIDELCSVIYI